MESDLLFLEGHGCKDIHVFLFLEGHFRKLRNENLFKAIPHIAINFQQLRNWRVITFVISSI